MNTHNVCFNAEKIFLHECIWGTIKKFLTPVLWEWPRAEIVPSFLNIISLCLNALSPMLFQFAYLFKTEAFTHKFLRVIFIDRQEILWKIKTALLLIFGQNSGNPSSWDLGHPKISVKIDWTAPKLMPIYVAISHRLLFLSHMIKLCTSSTFLSVVASLGCPDRS